MLLRGIECDPEDADLDHGASRLAIGRDPAIVRRAVLGPCSARADTRERACRRGCHRGAEQREDHRDLSRSGIRSKRWRYPTDAAKPFATVATLST